MATVPRAPGLSPIPLARLLPLTPDEMLVCFRPWGWSLYPGVSVRSVAHAIAVLCPAARCAAQVGAILLHDDSDVWVYQLPRGYTQWPDGVIAETNRSRKQRALNHSHGRRPHGLAGGDFYADSLDPRGTPGEIWGIHDPQEEYVAECPDPECGHLLRFTLEMAQAALR